MADPKIRPRTLSEWLSQSPSNLPSEEDIRKAIAYEYGGRGLSIPEVERAIDAGAKEWWDTSSATKPKSVEGAVRELHGGRPMQQAVDAEKLVALEENRALAARRAAAQRVAGRTADPTAIHHQREMAKASDATREVLGDVPASPRKPPGGFQKFLKKLPFFGTAVTAAMIPGEVQAAYDRGGETEAAKVLAVELARMGDPGFELLYDLAVAVPDAADAIASLGASKREPQRPAGEKMY